MKKISHLSIALLLMLITVKLSAQCTFTPSISPANPKLCPGGTDTLGTQVYETYQWFKNNVAISGATKRFLVITQGVDDDAVFKVAASKNGCTAVSKPVKAKALTFDPPSITRSGDTGVFSPSRDAFVVCPGDTMTLMLDSPYTVRVKWYNDGTALPGGHSQSYNVTRKGSYTASGAPKACPKYIVATTVPIKVFFNKPVATITEKDGTLFASEGKKYQWYSSNKKIPGATSQSYVPLSAGAYKVAITDAAKCTAVSDVYHFIPDGLNAVSVAPNPVRDVLRLNINATDARQVVIVDLYGNQKLKAPVTGNNQNIPVQNLTAGTYVVRVLNSKSVQIGSATIIKQ